MDEGEQITGIHFDPKRGEIAVGLYRVKGKKRTICVWAEDDLQARKIAAYAGLRNTSAEPVLVESNGSTGDGKRA